MSKDNVELVEEHLLQLTEMLESCEIEFENYSAGRNTVIELSNGTKFVFDSLGMLVNIKE
ncbi:MAG TPA: hypothetical protein VI911_11500 [Patescibacteria group bacterium]|nr:hypothetical protein [Patescibacteria group bacterium]